MTYTEFVGLPGSGKTTKKNKLFPKHINSFSFKKLNFKIVNDVIFFYQIYKLKKMKRLFYSVLHCYSIRTSVTNLILDQGLLQIYFSLCAENSIEISTKIVSKIKSIIDENFHDVRIILDTKNLSYEEVNIRLKNRCQNRANGLDLTFYETFNKNISMFKQISSFKIVNL